MSVPFVAVAVFLLVTLSATKAVNVVHFPPHSTNINNLTFVLNGSGAPGIFNSSTTPDNVYGEYNWCNMPHVRTKEYKYVYYELLIPVSFIFDLVSGLRRTTSHLNMLRSSKDTTSVLLTRQTRSSRRILLGVVLVRDL